VFDVPPCVSFGMGNEPGTTGAAAPPLESVRARDADHVRALQLERLRAMSATEKVAVMHALHRQALALTRARVRARHPEWTADEVEASVRAAFLKPQP
jgi:hypothetical protein